MTRLIVLFTIIGCSKGVDLKAPEITVNCPRFESKFSEKEYIDAKAENLSLKTAVQDLKRKAEDSEKDLLAARFDKDFAEIRMREIQNSQCEPCPYCPATESE